MTIGDYPTESSASDAEKPPLVVFCDVYPILYGAQRSMLEIYRRWHHRHRFRLHFAYTTDGELTDAVRALGIPCTPLQAGPLLSSYHKKLLHLRCWEYPRLVKELRQMSRCVARLLADQGAALLHCNTDRAGLTTMLGARRAKCPMVTHIRRDRCFGLLDRFVYRGSTDLIWVSHRVRDEFAARHGIASPKGPVIYNGRTLPDADGPPTKSDLCAEFRLPASAHIALVVAGFDVRKDHETLVEVAKTSCQADPQLCFLLAGVDLTPGEQRMRTIRGLVADAGLTDRVRLLGHRNDVGRLMRGADVLVNTAREEALGGVLIEAIGYGLPCVATDVGGTAEIVPHGVCGLLALPGDHASLARRILEILGDDDLRRRFSSAGKARFAEHFQAERCAERTAAFFDEVICRHSPHRPTPSTRAC